MYILRFALFWVYIFLIVRYICQLTLNVYYFRGFSLLRKSERMIKNIRILACSDVGMLRC